MVVGVVNLVVIPVVVSSSSDFFRVDRSSLSNLGVKLAVVLSSGLIFDGKSGTSSSSDFFVGRLVLFFVNLVVGLAVVSSSSSWPIVTGSSRSLSSDLDLVVIFGSKVAKRVVIL